MRLVVAIASLMSELSTLEVQGEKHAQDQTDRERDEGHNEYEAKEAENLSNNNSHASHLLPVGSPV